MRSKKIIFLCIFVASSVAVLLGFEFTQSGSVPKGWFQAGSNPESYEIGVEKGAGQNSSNAAFIKSIKPDIKGFGTLMQSFSGENYLGKRVMLSGYIKSKDVVTSAGFWMRIDDRENPKQQLGFDNMYNRPIKGNTEWKICKIVLDVPENSGLISFGAMIVGTGEIWFSNLKFEVVDKSVPTTDINPPAKIVEPLNLDFME